MTIHITPCTDPTELYRHYDGQSEPQPAYIELDTQAGTLLADYDAEIGNAVPATVWHGLERRYSIPILTADAANRVMKEIVPFAERIVAGTEAEWDGHNTVAVMNEDAQAAEEELEDHLGCNLGQGDFEADTQGFSDSDLVAVWDLDGATNGQEADEYNITADTTDARLEEIEQQILADLAGGGESRIAVWPELGDYLKQLRDGLAEEDPLTSAELRTAREYLGLKGDDMAKKLGVNPRTLRSWEQGRDPAPGRIRPEIAALKAATEAAVARLVTSLDDAEDATLYTYRDNDEYAAGVRGTKWSEGWHGWSASWHRQVCARAAAQTGARIDYANEVADEA